MEWLEAILWTIAWVVPLLALLVYLLHFYIIRTYLPEVVRIFQEKPLFIIPVGQPIANAETVRFPTSNGLTLCGCYLAASGPRKGVIVFGLEFGSNRWSCASYCGFLRDQGFDIFAFEFRGQGESDVQPGYEPLQWVTDYEVEDFHAALAYLKNRPDADPNGVGLFGISKGGSAGLLAAAADPYVRCFVVDGIFASHTTMVPYMQKWIHIFCKSSRIAQAVPPWYYRYCGHLALHEIEHKRGCHFPHLEHVIHLLAPRPLLQIHGGGDTYIKPEMARALFDLAAGHKEFWLVDGAKHNQAFQLVPDEYQQRVLAFFEEHLAEGGNKPIIPARPLPQLPAHLPEPKTNGQADNSPPTSPDSDKDTGDRQLFHHPLSSDS